MHALGHRESLSTVLGTNRPQRVTRLHTHELTGPLGMRRLTLGNKRHRQDNTEHNDAEKRNANHGIAPLDAPVRLFPRHGKPLSSRSMWGIIQTVGTEIESLEIEWMFVLWCKSNTCSIWRNAQCRFSGLANVSSRSTISYAQKWHPRAIHQACERLPMPWVCEARLPCMCTCRFWRTEAISSATCRSPGRWRSCTLRTPKHSTMSKKRLQATPTW